MKEVQIVTVFLWHKGKVCLVKRSSKVSTYQGYWSGISGYLEGDPMEHYKDEIQEETSLIHYEYKLIRRIEPVKIVDDKLGNIWFVHPFLCEIYDPSRIRLDWENSEYQWFDPSEIQTLKTVPGLVEIFKKVSDLPVKNEVLTFTENLRNNKHSGARQMALESLNFLINLIIRTNTVATDALIKDITYACDQINLARPSMAILSTMSELLMRDIFSISEQEYIKAKKMATEVISKHIDTMKLSINQVISYLDEIIPYNSTVLLHSYSSTVICSLPHLKNKSCSLIVTEARPNLEGRETARIAAEMGLKVKLITDACAASELNDVDIVLLGSDSIEQDGSIINKAGSALIAMAAYTKGVKVYFLSELRKIFIKGERVELEEHDPGEVWEEPSQGLSVKNIYFDRTPPRYISGIILEQGIVDPYQIKKISHSISSLNYNKPKKHT